MVLGIISLVLSGTGFITALIGLILGINGKKKAIEVGAPTGTAKAGIIMCVISLALTVLFTIACIACVAALGTLDYGSAFDWYDFY